MSNHKETVDANLAIFNSEFAIKYDNKETQQLLALLFTKYLLEYDFKHPTLRKTPHQTQISVGDPTKPFDGFSIQDSLPNPDTYLQDYPDTIFRPGMKLLDFACGTGMVTELFTPYVQGGGQLIGMDISNEFLNRFNVRAEKYTDPVMKSYRYDILDESKQEELKQFEGQFDAIICTIAYHHIHNYEQVTKKLATFLKPNGWLFIVDFYNEDVENITTTTTTTTKSGGGVSKAVQHMGGLKIENLNHTLGNIAGLKNVSSAREFKAWVWQPQLFIDTHLNQETIDKLKNGQLKQRTVPDGDIEYLIEISVIFAVGQR